MLAAAWLGPPIATDDPAAVQQIDRIRRSLGGRPSAPTQHLGEAQIIHHVTCVEPTARIATDDRYACAMAERRGLTVLDTRAILSECFEAHLVDCPEAYELLRTMAAAGRGVLVPESHWQVCPPVSARRRS